MIPDVDSKGVKRKKTEALSPNEQARSPKKLRKPYSESDDDAPTHPNKFVKTTAASRRSTRGTGSMPLPVNDKLYSQYMPGNVDRATAGERTRARHAEERKEKKQKKEEEDRARQGTEEYEQARMEANFVETMREHEILRHQGQMSVDDLMQHQPAQTDASPLRQQPVQDFVGIQRPRELNHFATVESKKAMHAAEVVRQQKAAGLVEAGQNHSNGDSAEAGEEPSNGNSAEAGQEQSNGNAAEDGGKQGDANPAEAGLKQSNGDSEETSRELRNGEPAEADQEQSYGHLAEVTPKVKAKGVVFSEEVEVRTFSDEGDSVASSARLEASTSSDEDEVHGDEQQDRESDDSMKLRTPASDRHGNPTSQAGPPRTVNREILEVSNNLLGMRVRAEELGAANILSGIRLTDQTEKVANPRTSGPTHVESTQLFEHDVVHTEVELSNVALLDAKFRTVGINCPDRPESRVIHVTLEDQFDKLGAIILNGLSHGDLTEVFATNFLLSLTMRFYAHWNSLSKDWHFQGNTRSVEAVRLDMDLVKWIYRVLWHSTKANTFWDAKGVLRVRRDKSRSRGRNRRDSIDSNATEPETGDFRPSNTIAEPVDIEEPQRNGVEEEWKEKEWALKTSWLEWARENELGLRYSEEDIHAQRIVWAHLVAEYSDVSAYGAHHTYKGVNNTAENNNNPDHHSNEDPHIIDDSDSNAGDDGNPETENEDDVKLVLTRANYRHRVSAPHPSATETRLGGSEGRPIPIDEAIDLTGILAQPLSRANKYNSSIARMDLERNAPPISNPSATSRPSLIVRLKISPSKLALATGTSYPPDPTFLAGQKVTPPARLGQGKERGRKTGQFEEPASARPNTTVQPQAVVPVVNAAAALPSILVHPPRATVRRSAVSGAGSFRYNVIDPRGYVEETSNPVPLQPTRIF